MIDKIKIAVLEKPAIADEFYNINTPNTYQLISLYSRLSVPE